MSKLIDLNSSTILSTLEEHQNELSQRGARKIGLFGSYSRGRFSSRSDLDFLVELEELSFDRYMNVKFFL